MKVQKGTVRISLCDTLTEIEAITTHSRGPICVNEDNGESQTQSYTARLRKLNA